MPWLYLVSLFVGLGLGMANAIKKVVSPPLVLAYAAVEGIFLGGITGPTTTGQSPAGTRAAWSCRP